MKSVTFTNNLSRELADWMEKYSLQQGLTRRAVLEKALNEFRKSVRRKEYTQSFSRASLDAETRAMAEDGMGDYFKGLLDLEK